ncbi:hypothetical protein N7470_004254 [Penicillium chermesinum]|nr:hypothetical protein N7470_004254 [Penicillium chermesinum]
MNDVQHLTSSRGGPYAEVGASSGPSMSQLSGETCRTETVQVPRSPQPLSLQIDGLNARIFDRGDDALSRVESSERGSDTSADPRRPELQSASTVTDSFSSLPLSSLHDDSRSMEIENSQTSNEEDQTPKAYSRSEVPPHIDENGSINASAGIKKEGNWSLSPLQSTEASDLPSSNESHFKPGHKRTATGDIKPMSSGLAAPDALENGAQRRRSKTIGASAHGSRIAQLSVHIRTRLSYAAAKIEKSRQTRDTKTQDAIRELEKLVSETPSAASTPGLKPSPYLQSPQPTTHARPHLSHQRSQSTMSSSRLTNIPKLAPPVDIVPSNGDTNRRRPPQYSRLSSPVLGTGTPRIPPSSRMTLSAQHEFFKSHTQNTSMEQDAIETLIFMSSPENSGYRSSPRDLQPAATQASLNESLFSNGHGGPADQSQSSQSDRSLNGRSFELRPAGLGLEADAGDAIDRILDQMDSDSEDDTRYASHRHRAYMPPSSRNHAPPR